MLNFTHRKKEIQKQNEEKEGLGTSEWLNIRKSVLCLLHEQVNRGNHMTIEEFIEKSLDKISTYHGLRKILLASQHGWELPWPNEDTRNWFISHFLMKQTL